MSYTFLATIIVSGLIVGGLMNFPVSLLPALKRQLRWTESRAFLLQWVFFLGVVGAMVLGGICIHELGTKPIHLLGSFMAVLGLVGLAFLAKKSTIPEPELNEEKPETAPQEEESGKDKPKQSLSDLARTPNATSDSDVGNRQSLPVILGAVLLLAMGAAFLHTSTAVSMPDAFLAENDQGNLNIEQFPAATNFGYLFVGIGFLLTPLLVRGLLRITPLRVCTLLLGLICLSPVALSLMTDKFPSFETTDFSMLLSKPNLWIIVVAVFFLYGLEYSMVVWAPKYLKQLEFQDKTMWLLISCFWLCFLAGRLISAQLAGKFTFFWLLVLAALLVAVTLGNMVGVFRKSYGIICFLFLGLCLGPVFPTLVGLIFYDFPKKEAVTFGIICGLGTLGRVMYQTVYEGFAERNHVRYSLTASMIMALMVAIPALVLVVTTEFPTE